MRSTRCTSARGADVVGQVLQHVEGHDEVEPAVGEREPMGVRAQDGQPALGRDPGPLLAVLEGDRLPAEAGEHAGVAATGGADVQRSTRRDVAQRGGEQVPPLAVPPVPVLEVDELADLRRVH